LANYTTIWSKSILECKKNCITTSTNLANRRCYTSANSSSRERFLRRTKPQDPPSITDAEKAP
jgi:hypothetical protein